MKKIISLVCLFLLLLRAIPVLDLCYAKSSAFYTCVDEGKEECKGKKEGKEFFILHHAIIGLSLSNTFFPALHQPLYTPPLLAFLTPPPETCLF